MELQIFKNEQFGQVRMVEVDGQPYFVGKDVAEILDYKEPNKAIARHIDEDDRTKHPITDSLGRTQDTYIINESGLYSLILSSKLPQAKEFKRWVTSEVLPAIRKNGAYVTDYKAAELLNNPNSLGDFLQGLTNQVKRLEQKNEDLQLELNEAQKQARYLDLIIESKGAVRVTQIAADYGMSATKFNKLLHELGVQHQVNGQWILYKKYMGKGYTDSTTFDFVDKNGNNRTNMTTTWTQKGRLFLYELLKEHGILPLIERDGVA